MKTVAYPKSPLQSILRVPRDIYLASGQMLGNGGAGGFFEFAADIRITKAKGICNSRGGQFFVNM